jgi:hypothetical protein
MVVRVVVVRMVRMVMVRLVVAVDAPRGGQVTMQVRVVSAPPRLKRVCAGPPLDRGGYPSPRCCRCGGGGCATFGRLENEIVKAHGSARPEGARARAGPGVSTRRRVRATASPVVRVVLVVVL